MTNQKADEQSEHEWEQALLRSEALPVKMAAMIVDLHQYVLKKVLAIAGGADFDTIDFAGDVPKMVEMARLIHWHAMIHSLVETTLCVAEAAEGIQDATIKAIEAGDVERQNPLLPKTMVDTIGSHALQLNSLHNMMRDMQSDHPPVFILEMNIEEPEK